MKDLAQPLLPVTENAPDFWGVRAKAQCESWTPSRRLAQNFVLMPQARIMHQPRSASKAARPPPASSSNPSHIEYGKANQAPTKQATAHAARKMRPVLSMLGEKNALMLFLKRGSIHRKHRPENYATGHDLPQCDYRCKDRACDSE